MNNLNIHKVTEVRAIRKTHLRESSGDTFHTLTIETYDRDHNTMEIILYSKNPLELEIEDRGQTD